MDIFQLTNNKINLQLTHLNMLDSIDRVSVEEDYCMACNIVVQIQLRRQPHTCNESMGLQDRSIQHHFEILLLCRCILMN